MTQATGTDIKFTYDTPGHEPVREHYGERKFRPIRTTITSQSGELYSARIEGPNIKVDGTDGANQCGRTYNLTWTSDAKHMPAWLIELVRATERRYQVMRAADPGIGGQ